MIQTSKQTVKNNQTESHIIIRIFCSDAKGNRRYIQISLLQVTVGLYLKIFNDNYRLDVRRKPI